MTRARGMTLAETMIALTGATLLGGTFLTFISAMRQSYQAQMAFSQLSGYIDIATLHVKRDIWNAVRAELACPAGAPQPGWTSWLALQAGPAGWGADGDVCYKLDPSAAANVRLVRWERKGGAWDDDERAVAQRLVVDPDPAVLDTDAVITAGQGVTVMLTASRTLFGRTYTRREPGATYRFQTPCPAAGCP